MKTSRKVLVSVMLMLHGGMVFAAADYSQLGTSLTRFGAEKKGSSDGGIPAYDGGLSTTPAGISLIGNVRPDPFANEKPLLSINAGNMAQFADKLTVGTKELMKRYPDYRIDVYPTHRTVSTPEWVQENTVQNAGKAKIAEDGYSLTGVRGSVPFPIPQSGVEAMWNALSAYSGLGFDLPNYSAYNVNSAGAVTLTTSGRFQQQNDFYLNNDINSGDLVRARADYSGPARRVGEAVMSFHRTNYSTGNRRAFQYLPGQRRVKLAPDMGYDTPNTSTSGMSTYDDVGMFTGPMDRFNFKIIGKKEVFVPYNAYRMVYASDANEVFKPKFVNPDVVRWEAHRVWVVEATLKEGKRHVYTKREFYIDEDSWNFLASDQYDARGNIWRAGFSYPVQNYDVGNFLQITGGHYDLMASSYYINLWPGKSGVRYMKEALPATAWSPDSLAGAGIR